MSLFLGKIHYWMFNKIIWFQNLEVELEKLAKNEGLNTEEILKSLDEKYGEKVENRPLEEIIDQGNIHGWLQDRIIIAENRLSALTAELLKIEYINKKIEEIYISQGTAAAEEVKGNNKAAEDAIAIYNLVNDYILDGMPCDRVNLTIEYEEDKVLWERRICVHKDIWEDKNIDVNYFYGLRDLWIKTFVEEVNANFQYRKLSEIEMVIERIR